MSDAAPPLQPTVPSGDAAPAGPLTPDAIDRVLADFRVWLGELAALPPAPGDAPAIDLHALVAQFTALRHEVNLQTRAARTSLEQTGEALEQLESAIEELRERPETGDNETTALLKALVDAYDNLALALRQVERQRAAIDQPLADLVEGTKVPDMPKSVDVGQVALRPGFWWRLFGVSAGKSVLHVDIGAAMKELEVRQQRTADAASLVRSSFDGLVAGYRMSLARVDRAIEQAGLEVVATEGKPFDPELMEVVEVVGNTGRPAGAVVEEVRRGYLRGDVVFRYAQVKVAR
ncbi:MAG TPA: nucleotide exchange factor GrpE [Gemmataceae bacterium]|nr:nucleotide exchange factor GrpE [Gemmataceae bacterium]